MKILIDDSRGASFLIFYIILFLGVIGIIYNFSSDIVDRFVGVFNILVLGHNDELTQWGFDALLFLFRFVLIFAFIGLCLFAYVMAQKPEVRWQ